MSSRIELPADAPVRDLTEPGLFSTITTQPWIVEYLYGTTYVFFVETLTEAQLQDARTIATHTVNELDLREQARDAMAVNDTFASTTFGQINAGADKIIAGTGSEQEKSLAQGTKLMATQLRALAYQNNAIIPLLLDEVDTLP